MELPIITLEKILVETIAGMGDAFAPNELAYLASTTKIELPFRDRLAYLLHRRLESDKLHVVREWRRVDLAILDASGSPVCLLELKAMYTFDAIGSSVEPFIAAMAADEEKASRLAVRGTAVYTMLLASHRSGAVNPELHEMVKYHGGINKAIIQHGSAAALRQLAEDSVQAALAGRDIAAAGAITGGDGFGHQVDILYWLVRKSGR